MSRSIMRNRHSGGEIGFTNTERNSERSQSSVRGVGDALLKYFGTLRRGGRMNFKLPWGSMVIDLWTREAPRTEIAPMRRWRKLRREAGC